MEAKTRKFFVGVLDGMQSPADVFEFQKLPRREGSDLQRLRGDVDRVGQLFRTVIARENERKKITARA